MPVRYYGIYGMLRCVRSPQASSLLLRAALRPSPVLRKSTCADIRRPATPSGSWAFRRVLATGRSYGTSTSPFPWGELLVLFGANGVGKTTLLRILSTQARPDEGSLVVAGFDQRRSPQAVRRRVGVVAHQTFHYDDLTCRENLHYYGRLFGLERLPGPRRRGIGQAGTGAPLRPPGAYPLQWDAEAPCPSPAPSSTGPGYCLLDEPEAGLDRRIPGHSPRPSPGMDSVRGLGNHDHP